MATLILDAGGLNHSDNMHEMHSTMTMLEPQFGLEFAQNAAASRYEIKAGIAEASLMEKNFGDLGTLQSMSIAQNAEKSTSVEKA